jgi:hypothetical protein
LLCSLMAKVELIRCLGTRMSPHCTVCGCWIVISIGIKTAMYSKNS